MRTLFCDWDGCEKPTVSGRTYCWMHQKRAQRGMKMSGESKPLFPQLVHSGGSADPRRWLLDAAVAWADSPAEDDAEYRRRTLALEAAARNFARAQPLASPSGG